MPNIAIADTVKRHYLEVIICLLLLFLVVPIKVKIENEDEVQFQKYLEAFNRSYDDNTTLYRRKLEAFKKSLRTIQLLNSNHTLRNRSAEYGLTKFSDMFPEEFLHTTLLPDLSTQLRNILFLPDNADSVEEEIDKIKQAPTKYNIPTKLDWRERNVVTKVINQDLCSACWAFSTIGMIESLHGIKTGKLKKLSIQQVIDCAKYSDGCNGGNICSLLQWLKTDQVKVLSEEEYPLVLENQICKNTSSTGVQIDDYKCADFVGSEEIILALVAKNGPVAVAVNALTWQNYIGGVIQFHCDNSPLKLNHAVEIIGYDLTGEVPYYIARNSWGEDFGDKGYLHLAVGKNTCGLAHEVSVVTLV